ncbi:hypothetical protein B0H13DRAFT_1895949 [Mycena leptocephala]|nr:hypothetical protein B0H13DRAFT_1895949 [Mycena leptocephala]
MSTSREHVPSSFDNHLRLGPLTDASTLHRDLILWILIPGIVFSSMVLTAFAYTASQRRSRPHLHRVSFRLLVYAMVSNKPPRFTTAIKPGMLAARLVLIHGVNGLIMEKYYVIGSSLLVGVCTIIPLVAGQFGPYNGVCWFSNPDPVLQIRWLVGAQSFWILLMALSELISVKRLRSDMSAKMTASESQYAAYTVAPVLQFRGIILRITLYPLLSCALNFSSTSLNLCLAQHRGNTELNFRLSVLGADYFQMYRMTYICIINARPFLYAVLAATDPSFIRAVSTLRQPTIAGRSGTPHGATSHLQSQASRRTTPSSGTITLVDGSKAENESASRARPSVDAPVRPQQTEAVVHNTRTHSDPAAQGIASDSSAVYGRKDSIEFQI